MKIKSSRNRRKAQPIVPYSKKPRSKLPRRRRSQICPNLCTSLISIDSDRKTSSSAFRSFPLDSRCSSHCLAEASCNSNIVSVVPDDLNVKHQRKRALDEIAPSGDAARDGEFRRVTRKYCRRKENERKCVKDLDVEASESSCVESCSGAEWRGFEQGNSKERNTASKIAQNLKRKEVTDDSEAISRSEISCVEQFLTANEKKFSEFSEKILESTSERARKTDNSSKTEKNKDNSVTSGIELSSETNFQNACSSIGELEPDSKATGDGENGASDAKLSKNSRNSVDLDFTISKEESTAEQSSNNSGCDNDLVCTEHLSSDDFPDYMSSLETTFADIFPGSSEINFSDYTPSIWLESESQFSERSQGDSTPSPTFSLFLQYSQQFSRASSSLHTGVSSSVENEYKDDFTLLRFERDEDEESYQRFRNRERRMAFLHNYAEDYRCTTEYGDLILQQRLEMVHWIVEQSATKELQNETMFLSVNLLDRFLSKGIFKSERILQIVGIACLALATRIEENQPLNSVRQKTFRIGSNIYSRCEVVAMEWLVQEVLSFQCFLPTIYNFLWFYLKAARASAEVEKMAKYLAVLALLDHDQLCFWPSTVAAGLVILAALAANQDASCQWVMETHVRTKDDDLPECIKSLEWLVKYVR
ncbi:cyclin-SDS [Malania oleifera]|uniref:cyclin-SDS n=1 Tax=Malania oleifera TaxID=397392 RepID=UPI0025AEC627|nr:cyclin-SDS [Malania oleifera]